MKVFLFSVCMMAAAWPVLSQSGDEKVVAYFDSDWKPVYDSAAAISYFRTVVPYGTHVIVRDYSLAGVKLMQAECSQYIPGLVRDGRVTYYYNNGNVKEEGVYERDERRGMFCYYDRTGAKREEREYDVNEVRYLKAYDESGHEQLVKDKRLPVERAENNASDAKNYKAGYVVRVVALFGPWIPTPFNGNWGTSNMGLPIEFNLGR